MALTELESEVVQGSTAAAAIVSALANVALLAHARSWRGAGAGDPERFTLRTVFFIAATNLGQCVGCARGNAPVLKTQKVPPDGMATCVCPRSYVPLDQIRMATVWNGSARG